MSVQNDMGSGISSGTSQLQQFGAAADNATNSTTTLQSKVKLSGADFTRLGLGIGAAASGALNLVRSYTSLTFAQTKVSALALREEKALKRVQDLRKKLNEVIAEYGENSIEAADAIEDLRLAEEAASVASQRHADAQTRLNQNMADFAISVIPSAIGIVAGLVQTFDILGARFNLTGGALGRITGLFRLHRAETQLSTVANTQLALSNTQLAAGVAPLTGAIAANNAQMLVGRNSAVGMAAGFQTAGASARTASVGVRGLGISIKGALIATGIGAIIIGITTALEAFAHNWFGAADALNKFAQQVRAALPTLKPLFDQLEKIWFFIMKTFGGEVPGAMDDTGDAMEDTVGSANKLRDAIKELTQRGADLINTMAMAKKGDRHDLLHSIGIKGGAEKRFKPILNDIEEMIKKITRLDSAIAFSQNLSNLEKFFDIPDSVRKKMAFTFEDVFNDIADLDIIQGTPFEGIFETLADQLERDAKNTNGKNFQKIIAETFLNHPEMLAMFKAIGLPPELINAIQTMMDQEAAKIRDRFNLPKVTEDQKTQFLKDIGMEPITKLDTVQQDVIVNLTDAQGNSLMLAGVGGGGSNLTTIVTNSLNTLFNAGAWHDAISKYFGAGVVIQGIMMDIQNQFTTGMNTAFGTTSPTLAGIKITAGWISGVISPLFNAGAWHDAIKSTLETGNYVLGILTDIGNQFMAGINDAPSIFTNAGVTILNIQPQIRGWIDTNIIAPILSAVEEVKANINTTLKPVFDFFNDPIGTILTWLGHGVAAAPTNTINVDASKFTITITAPEDTDTSKWTTWGGQVETEIGQVWIKLTAFASYVNTTFTTTIPVALQTSQTAFANLANQGANSLSILASASSNAMSGIKNNFSVGEVAAQGLQTGLANLSNEGIKSLKALAKASSTMANGIKNNMAVAVKAVNSLKSAISSLKSKTVTVSVKVSGAAKGGLMTFAGGGLMSAAGGTMFTANGQQQVTVGDNPGGRETVAFIPHNDPGPTLEKIARMFGSFGDSRTGVRVNSGGGSSSSSGPMIVQVFLDGQQVKGAVVKMISVNSGGFK